MNVTSYSRLEHHFTVTAQSLFQLITATAGMNPPTPSSTSLLHQIPQRAFGCRSNSFCVLTRCPNPLLRTASRTTIPMEALQMTSMQQWGRLLMAPSSSRIVSPQPRDLPLRLRLLRRQGRGRTGSQASRGCCSAASTRASCLCSGLAAAACSLRSAQREGQISGEQETATWL